MAGGRAMNYSAAARKGRARRGGRPGPRVPRRCEAAAATSQTFPGRHRGCGPRGASVPARARRPRFPRCRLFYVFCLGVGTCPRERVSLPTPSPPDRGGGGGTGDPERRRRGGGGKQGAYGPRSQERPPGDSGRARAPGRLCSAGRSSLRLCPEYQRGLRPPTPRRGRARCGRGRTAAPPRLPPPPRTLLPGPARAGGAGGASSGFAARAPRLAPQPRVRAPAGTPPRALPAARPRPAAPPACRRGQGGTAARTHPSPASRPGAARLWGGQARALAPARPAALAPRRLPERARRLRSEAPAAMIAGSGARAQARARLGDPGRTDGLWPARRPVRAAESG